MADVQPLRALRYAHEYVDDLSQVITPPYDVISQADQARYYARNPYNVIRLELGLQEPGDNTLNNVYTRAAATLSEWRLQQILQEDADPSYYLYQQQFTRNGQSHTRTSLLARVRLEAWDARVVLPHEYTLAKAKDDRLKLLRACSANFSPIMSLYDDPQGRMRRLLSSYAASAEVRIVDEVGETHVLQAVTNAEHIALIQDFFAERQLYIADGHHRYETALAYRSELSEQRRGLHADDAANFVFMALIDIDDPGLLVLPTHRVLSSLSQSALDALASERLAQYFSVQDMTGGEQAAVLAQLAQAGQQQPALLVSTPQQTRLLTLNTQGRQRMETSGRSDAWNKLDVAIVQTLLLEDLLGLNAQDMTAGTYARYPHDAAQALQMVQAGEAQVALLLNAPKVRQICDVAQADDRMPQKSTFFYPKLITGLVINPLW